ncbi:MAG: NAD(+) diphosphatase [Proteobacteria bacterium]|nr:NAD(+) diphosphatase [Pseudomonadota bacterium]
MTRRNYFLHPDSLNDTDRLVLFYQNQVLVRGENFVWSKTQLDAGFLEDSELLVIEEGNESFVAVHSKQDIAGLLDAENRSLRSLLFAEGDLAFSVAGKASQIIDWYNSHRYCGSCGSATENHGSERAVFCGQCERHFYPRINPCVIMLVVRGREMLLARSARFKGGFFSCLAGFIEVGETVEETLTREVKEEVGLEVHNLRYIKSQSWPFPSQLMLGFIAEYKSGEIVLQPDEIEEARWYDIDELPNVPVAGLSVAGDLILYYIDQVKSGSL